MTSTYQPLEVHEGYNRVDGRVYFVRDDEHGHLWHRVEYVDRRLTCWCPDGEAHAESPTTEPPCAHLRVVVDHRTAANKAAGPPLGTLVPAVFCD